MCGGAQPTNGSVRAQPQSSPCTADRHGVRSLFSDTAPSQVLAAPHTGHRSRDNTPPPLHTISQTRRAVVGSIRGGVHTILNPPCWRCDPATCRQVALSFRHSRKAPPRVDTWHSQGSMYRMGSTRVDTWHSQGSMYQRGSICERTSLHSKASNMNNPILAAGQADFVRIVPRLRARGIAGIPVPKLGVGDTTGLNVLLGVPSVLHPDRVRDATVEEPEYCAKALSHFVEPLVGREHARVSDL